jgi:hypothetical protein
MCITNKLEGLIKNWEKEYITIHKIIEIYQKQKIPDLLLIEEANTFKRCIHELKEILHKEDKKLIINNQLGQ